MNYTSERIREILKSPTARKFLDELPPVYDRAYIGLWLLEVIGREWDEICAWTDSLPYQIFPHKATWMLDDWEKEYGLNNSHLPQQQRQQLLLARRLEHKPLNPARLAQISSATLGVTVEITENIAPNTFGVEIRDYAGPQALARLAAVLSAVKPPRLTCVIRYNYDDALIQTSYDWCVISEYMREVF
jgi:hypothetical protein